ncbi:MAG: hypothetical protein R2713_20855 [Ilumatobacteraceae bacterium]
MVPESSLVELPPIEGNPEFEIIGWALEPGDAVYFHGLTCAAGLVGPPPPPGGVVAVPRRRRRLHVDAAVDHLAAVPGLADRCRRRAARPSVVAGALAVDMTVREIVTIGHPVLRERARDVTIDELLTPAVQRLIDDLVGDAPPPTVQRASPARSACRCITTIEVNDNPRYPYKPADPALPWW